MNPDVPSQSLQRKLLWPGLGTAALVVWTVYFHVTWLHRTGFIHGLLAFFVGLLGLILVNALVRLVIGAFKRGFCWLVSREALRLCAWTILFATSIVALFYTVELWRGKRAWAGVVQEAKLRGEPLTFDAIIPPAVPEEQNFAKAAIFAPLFERKWGVPAYRSEDKLTRLDIIELLEVPYEGWQSKSWPWLEQEKTDLHAQAEYYAGKKLPAFAEESQAAKSVLEALGKHAKNLAQLREFSARPYCRFPVPYERQMMDPPWHLNALWDLVHLLGRRASAELILRETDAALGDAQLALRLIEYSRQQPWAASSQMRMRMTVAALQPVWEGLAERRWTEPQLTDLQKQLEALNVIADCPAQIRADALYMSAFVESLMPTTRPPQPLDLDMEGRVLNFLQWILPVGWSLQDQAAIRRFQFRWTEAPVNLNGQLLTPDAQKAQPLFASSDPFFAVFVTRKMQRLVYYGAENFTFSQTAVNQATLACALERYRLTNGSFPKTLEVLSPRYLGKLPADLVTGEPLKYRPTAEDRFILYSVGFNKTDDGGKPAPREEDWQGRSSSFPDLRKDDWVWAYASPPATP